MIGPETLRFLTAALTHLRDNGDFIGRKEFLAWGQEIVAALVRTPDPAQIRADALREAVKLPEIAAMVEYYKANRAVQRTGLFYATEEQFRRQSRAELDADEAISALDALIATPLSPSAVDGSPAPDAAASTQPVADAVLRLKGVDQQVIATAALLGDNGRKNPEWAFIDYEANSMSFGRWAKCGPNPAPYIRADIVLPALTIQPADPPTPPAPCTRLK